MVFDPENFLSETEDIAVKEFDTQGFLKTDIDDKEIITQRDPSRMETIRDFSGEVIKGGKREIGGLLRTTRSISEQAAKDYLTFKGGAAEQKSKRGREIGQSAVQVLRESPTLLKDVVSDIGRTFGIDFNRSENKLSFETAMEKWKSAPIESVLDATFLGGIAKSGAKSLFKSTAKFINHDFKKGTQQIFGKGDVETEVILKHISNKEVNTVLGDLYDESNIIRRLDIRKQLDNPNYVEEVGKSTVENIQRLKKRDQIKLSSSINKIKTRKIDMKELQSDIADQLDKTGFLKEGKILDIDNIEPGLSKSALKTEILRLNEKRPLTAGDLKKRMDNLDNKINWKSPKTADSGLIQIRRSYRNQIRKLSPDYNERALLVSEKLDLFESKLKKMEKVGGGESFGKSMFSTREEMNEFIKLMEKSPDKITGKILGDLKTLKAWHAWNRYFKQNPSVVFSNVDRVAQGALPILKKRAIKADLTLRSPRPHRHIFNQLKRSPKPVRVGLELSEEEKI